MRRSSLLHNYNICCTSVIRVEISVLLLLQVSPEYVGLQMHSNPFSLSTHWPPLRQGSIKHSLTSVSHRVPVNPALQVQVYRLSLSTHVPLFWQGSPAHSSMSLSHCTPSYPGLHEHWYPSAKLLHVASFRHGDEAQWSIFISQNFPP